MIELTRRAIDELTAAQEDPLPHWATPVDEDARRLVYLVTLSSILKDEAGGQAAAGNGVPAQMPVLRDPHELTKQQARDAVLDAIANPILPSGGRPRTRKPKATKIINGKEPHIPPE